MAMKPNNRRDIPGSVWNSIQLTMAVPLSRAILIAEVPFSGPRARARQWREITCLYRKLDPAGV
jgi:hypothetical protein